MNGANKLMHVHTHVRIRLVVAEEEVPVVREKACTALAEVKKGPSLRELRKADKKAIWTAEREAAQRRNAEHHKMQSG